MPDLWIRWFKDLSVGDTALVGGKNASLGELYRQLSPMGVKVPNGFAVTARAFRDFIEEAELGPRIEALLEGIDQRDLADFARRAEALRELVREAPLPDGLESQIVDAYRALEEEYGADADVAVRSSATAEDLPNASFAGQHDSFLNIRGARQLVHACRRCFASLFTDRAISYRIDQGFDHMSVALSVGVQKMVRSDLAASGVMFSLDTESGFRDVVFITGGYGLGENIVQGTVDPDEFYVHKPTLAKGFRPIVQRSLGQKQLKMVYSADRAGSPTRNIATPPQDQQRFCITDDEVLTLATYAVQIEEHYSEVAGVERPMDIEWAKDGESGDLFVIQARPETVASQKQVSVFEDFVLHESGPELARGRAIGDRIATGPVRVVRDAAELVRFEDGDVLIAPTTTPDWEPVMKRASAIVTDSGGRTCHAAILARELGIPAVVGTRNATTKIGNGEMVTVSCAEGETGRVYRGKLAFDVTQYDVSDLERPKTHIMINLGNPDLAFRTAAIPNDGIGLARLEFIINESIGVHPMALVHPDQVEDSAERARIGVLTRGYRDGAEFFIERLAEGVATIGAAFYPKPVIVRLSDFKTNEYAQLLGGRYFEPEEANPMIGFRGAARYAHPRYRDGFRLECTALRRVRSDMGLKNIKIMVPFCRRIDEAKATLDFMAENGLRRGEDGLEVYVMCEIPSNVLQIDAFAELFDGFSIGSNDLTQLVLGVDRDSEVVAFDFDERDPAVKHAIRMAIQGARRHGRHIGICGQAPSDYLDFAEFLVAEGIESISLTPDRVIPTTQAVLALEKGEQTAAAGE